MNKLNKMLSSQGIFEGGEEDIKPAPIMSTREGGPGPTIDDSGVVVGHPV